MHAIFCLLVPLRIQVLPNNKTIRSDFRCSYTATNCLCNTHLRLQLQFNVVANELAVCPCGSFTLRWLIRTLPRFCCGEEKKEYVMVTHACPVCTRSDGPDVRPKRHMIKSCKMRLKMHIPQRLFCYQTSTWQRLAKTPRRLGGTQNRKE